jgi:hypothetical protein
MVGSQRHIKVKPKFSAHLLSVNTNDLSLSQFQPSGNGLLSLGCVPKFGEAQGG